MAKKDLKPVRSKEEAKSRGKKGGIASGVARREKKTLRQCLEALLAQRQKGDDGKTISGAEAAAAAIYAKAKAGDVRAFEVLRDTVGEKPSDKLEITKYEQIITSMSPEERRKVAQEMGQELGLL